MSTLIDLLLVMGTDAVAIGLGVEVATGDVPEKGLLVGRAKGDGHEAGPIIAPGGTLQSIAADIDHRVCDAGLSRNHTIEVRPVKDHEAR